MNEIQLQNISCKVAGNRAQVFTVPKDMLHNISVHKKPTIINCNTGNSGTEGEHWVWFYIQNKEGKLVADFMDSYGNDHEFYNIKFPYEITNYNNRQLQSFDSDKCGQYCLAFTYYRVHNIPFKKICTFFSTNYNENDYKVTALYKKLTSRVSEGKQAEKSCNVLSCKTFKSVLERYHHDPVSTHSYCF